VLLLVDVSLADVFNYTLTHFSPPGQDMALHFSTLAKFKANVSDALAAGVSDATAEGRAQTMAKLMGDSDIRLMVMQMCIKSADVANAAKPWSSHEMVRKAAPLSPSSSNFLTVCSFVHPAPCFHSLVVQAHTSRILCAGRQGGETGLVHFSFV
jgi:hypothetical protein